MLLDVWGDGLLHRSAWSHHRPARTESATEQQRSKMQQQLPSDLSKIPAEIPHLAVAAHAVPSPLRPARPDAPTPPPSPNTMHAPRMDASGYVEADNTGRGNIFPSKQQVGTFGAYLGAVATARAAAASGYHQQLRRQQAALHCTARLPERLLTPVSEGRRHNGGKGQLLRQTPMPCKRQLRVHSSY